MCPGFCKTHPFPVGKRGTVVVMAEQGEAGVYKRFRISAALQHAAHLVLQLAENITMAELSAGANMTGLACLLHVYDLIAEIASFCNAGNVTGDAATCFVAILAEAVSACPFCWPGLRDAEDPALFHSELLLQLGWWQRENLKLSKEERVLRWRIGGMEALPNVLVTWAPNCHQV